MRMRAMTWEVWERKYQPVINTIEEDAPIDGLMFETYGEEYKAVEEVVLISKTEFDKLPLILSDVKTKVGTACLEHRMKDKKNLPWAVWTIVDGDDNASYAVPGKHFVNRTGYFITRIPYTKKDEVDLTVKI